MWRPDGWGWRARIGLLVPHADMCPEAEFMAMAPPGVSIRPRGTAATRVRFISPGSLPSRAPHSRSICSHMSVSTMPGATALTRMPCFARESAALCVMAMTAN